MKSFELADALTGLELEIQTELDRWASEEERPSRRDFLHALSMAICHRLASGYEASRERFDAAGAKQVHYLSMEFLIGRSLACNLDSLGLRVEAEQAAAARGFSLEDLLEEEEDAALGSGGLGRLAACFLDSLATLGYAGHGYGLYYRHGLFHQKIEDGNQVELPDAWQTQGTPWTIERPEEERRIPAYGFAEMGTDEHGRQRMIWKDPRHFVGVPHDILIAGYGGETVNRLRLYAARPGWTEGGTGWSGIEPELISDSLYPSMATPQGRELRLVQEYFLVACAIHDVVRDYLTKHDSFEHFPQNAAIQMNDTHPALAVAELMRVLVDDHGVHWDDAWRITQSTLGFTNHTLQPEALETWPIDLLERVLPRHLHIIYQINIEFLVGVRALGGDAAMERRMSILEDGPEKKVRMAHLAIVGSHSVNGVAHIHSELVKSKLVPDFYSTWPERFSNKTNGVTQRRWLLTANPGLAALISSAIGDGWVTDYRALERLEAFASDEGFQNRFRAVKRANKERLARVIHDTTGVAVDTESLFDVQIKRIHEYKRQLLNVLHVIHDYLRLVDEGVAPAVPRTYVFAGKAAPDYWQAKQVIKLIHSVADVVNRDPRAKGWMKVVFLPNYRVTLAERIIPAADLSEQISTAGHEASGTGNMKFVMNGALTIGTLDGANIEIQELVGEDCFFEFGLTVEQAENLSRSRSYAPASYMTQPSYWRVLDSLCGDRFSPGEPGLFRWFRDRLLSGDEPFLHLADLPSYVEAHARANAAYADASEWSRKAILGVARSGFFSSDRTIRQYADEIWEIWALTGSK
jgi:glycogen phosphorylase